MRIRKIIASMLLTLLSASAQGGNAPDPVGKSLPAVLEAWQQRIDGNGGVHAWNRHNDGMRVFQEWITVLTKARAGTPEEKRRAGKALEKYVVGGDMRPLGFVGTSLPMPGYEDGDFDMSLMGCASLLWLFQDEPQLLTDAAMAHLVAKVVRLWGQSPKAYFDVFFVSVPETENHLFMIESTRYLINQLILANPRGLKSLASLRDSLERSGVMLDNRRGSLRQQLLKVMHQAMCKGFFEFNAQIYQRFTIHALDNLYSFADDRTVADAAGCLLDYLSTAFAFQSYGSIRYGPYRRSSETYMDSSLVSRDAACSFFAVQSGVFPWKGESGRGLWRTNTAHASMALFSSVLKYRVPAPILHYMRERPGEYRAEIRSAYAEGRGTTEIYYGSRNALLTAGGRYETYAGPNFPTASLWFRGAPWVYDVITRSSSVMIDPIRDRPHHVRDILHFRGSQWKANNMAVRRNFMYGYVPMPEYNSPAWPQHVPAGWKIDSGTHSTRDFDFRFVDRSDAGVYLVLSRVRAEDSWLHWGYQKFARGAVEIVDASRVASLDELKETVLARNASSPAHRHGWSLGRRYVYTDMDGSRIYLNPRYDGHREGISKVVESPAASDAGIPLVSLPFSFPWTGDGEPEGARPALAGFALPAEAPEQPLFQVDMYAPWKGKVALSDGKGNMYVFNPATGGYCLSNFREWWNPRRKIQEPAGGNM